MFQILIVASGLLVAASATVLNDINIIQPSECAFACSKAAQSTATCTAFVDLQCVCRSDAFAEAVSECVKQQCPDQFDDITRFGCTACSYSLEHCKRYRANSPIGLLSGDDDCESCDSTPIAHELPLGRQPLGRSLDAMYIADQQVNELSGSLVLKKTVYGQGHGHANVKAEARLTKLRADKMRGPEGRPNYIA